MKLRHFSTPGEAFGYAFRALLDNLTEDMVDTRDQDDDPERVAELQAKIADLEAVEPVLGRMIEEHPQLVATLTDMTPLMPGADAPCHIGICSQSECQHCSRIAASHALLRQVRERQS